MIVGIIEFVRLLNDEGFAVIMAIPELKALYQASKPWLERNDH
jgi:hypothetical protein